MSRSGRGCAVLPAGSIPLPSRRLLSVRCCTQGMELGNMASHWAAELRRCVRRMFRKSGPLCALGVRWTVLGFLGGRFSVAAGAAAGVRWCWHGLVLWTRRLEGCRLLLGLCLAGRACVRPVVPSRWGFVSQSEPVGVAGELLCKRSGVFKGIPSLCKCYNTCKVWYRCENGPCRVGIAAKTEPLRGGARTHSVARGYGRSVVRSPANRIWVGERVLG